VYVVRLGDAPSCTCPAGRNDRHCYHVATALSRYGAFYTAPWAVLVPATNETPAPPPAAPAALPLRSRCQAALYPACACTVCTVRIAA